MCKILFQKYVWFNLLETNINVTTCCIQCDKQWLYDQTPPVSSITTLCSPSLLSGRACALKTTWLHSVRVGLCGQACRRSADGVVMFWPFCLLAVKTQLKSYDTETCTHHSVPVNLYFKINALTWHREIKMKTGMHISGVMMRRLPTTVAQVPGKYP